MILIEANILFFILSIPPFPLEDKAVFPKGVGIDLAHGSPPQSLRTSGYGPKAEHGRIAFQTHCDRRGFTPGTSPMTA